MEVKKEKAPIRISKELHSLPKPVAIYHGKEVMFRVYRAKNLFEKKWTNAALRDLTLTARKSYYRYGKRPLIDREDQKAAIYLVQAKYYSREQKQIVQEWLSIRMVPGDGNFLGVSEPEIFYYKDKSIDGLLMRKTKILKKSDFWKNIASSSRMCGLGPFTANLQMTDMQHKYTPMCFAIIHAQFLIDYPLNLFPYKYITATIRPDFVRKGLSIRSNKKNIHPVFWSVEKFLKLPRKAVKVDRQAYAYDFPSYWLNRHQMKIVAKELLKLKVISDKTYLNNPFKLLSRKIHGMSQKKLHSLIDKKVDDIPGLKVTPVLEWYEGMGKVLTAARVKMPAFLKTVKLLKEQKA